jgi:hypothetical protein
MMKKVVIAVLFLATAQTALAQVGPLTTARTCGEDRALIDARGSAVLSTSAMTYGRYVKDGAYCLVDQFPAPAWVPSADNPQCFIGYRCSDGPNDSDY